MLFSPTFLFLVPLSLPQESDATAISEHIDSIFRAYIEKDRAGVLATHTTDWLGYQSRSVELVRGIEGYMVNANWALENGGGWKHEMIEIEPRVYGEIAVAPYVARYFIRRGEEELTILYRAIDIYRREDGGWNQCGTNICVMSDEPPAYPSPEDFATYPQLRPVPASGAPQPSSQARSAWKARHVSAADEKELRRATRLALESASDAAALGELRTDDWVGFELASTAVVTRDGDVLPGADEWTTSIAKVEILAFEAQRYSDVVLVFALARCSDDTGGAGGSFLVRTAEVYRDTERGWRQCAAHPNPIPDVLAD